MKMPGLILAGTTLSSCPMAPNHHQSAFICHKAVYQICSERTRHMPCRSTLQPPCLFYGCSQVLDLYRNNAYVLSCVSRRLLLVVFLSLTLILPHFLSPSSKHINKSLYPWFFITACLALSLKVRVWTPGSVSFFSATQLLDMHFFWIRIIPD